MIGIHPFSLACAVAYRKPDHNAFSTLADFIRAAHVVSGVELSFPVVQLAFRIFDNNGESCNEYSTRS